MKKIELIRQGQGIDASFFMKINETITAVNKLIDKQEVKVNEKTRGKDKK